MLQMQHMMHNSMGGPSGGGMMMMGESGSGPMMKHDRGWN